MCRSASIRARASCAASANDLSAPLALPRLPAVLVNPGVAVPTKEVFAGLEGSPAAATALAEASLAKLPSARELVRLVAEQTNDLEPPAITLQP